MLVVKDLCVLLTVFLPEKRDEFKKKLYSKGLIVIGCGEKTIRFRPPLVISSEEIDKILSIISNTLKTF